MGPDTVKKMSCVSSNPDDHIKFARQYLDLGFDQLYFHTAGPDQISFLKNLRSGWTSETTRPVEKAIEIRSVIQNERVHCLSLWGACEKKIPGIAYDPWYLVLS